MMFCAEQDLTILLQRWNRGDPAALDEILPKVYRELRKLGRYYLSQEPPEHTLQGTALVHEVFLRLRQQHSIEWKDRSHFLSAVGNLMRRVLIDYARKRHAEKRGAGLQEFPFDDALRIANERPRELISLHDALEDLARFDPRKAQVIEFRFFSGLSVDEIAAVLDISPATVKREWTVAKAWLHGAMTVRA
jgi:RNA polymerase sigma factor (TIGR02999 family)